MVLGSRARRGTVLLGHVGGTSLGMMSLSLASSLQSTLGSAPQLEGQ